MSIIVFNPKERCIMADSFILEFENKGQYSQVGLKTEDKLHVTEDKKFAYVFKETQYEKYVPIILSFIERLEFGTLPEDETPPNLKEDFILYVMSGKYFYRFGSQLKNPLQRTTIIETNLLQQRGLFDALDLTSEEIMDVLYLSGVCLANDRYKRVDQKDLVVIKPVKKTKTKGVKS